MTIVSKTSTKNNSETNGELEILGERFVSSELRRKVVDDLS